MATEIIIRSNARIKSRQWWLKVTKALYQALKKYLSKNKSNVNILITTNKEIKNLNKKFRKINMPTDVLSFSSTIKEHLGDIVISIQKAKEQALKKNITLETELITLLTHGYLHLLGYDHKLPKEKKQMFRVQDKIIQCTSQEQ
ncbi:MAG: rRNA maturation RNase YbeY [Candidatus Melainabacteria bacterium]|nr:rRNA maturation RNase YbeY [Candidatus Melainabacteria bacterium]